MKSVVEDIVLLTNQSPTHFVLHFVRGMPLNNSCYMLENVQGLWLGTETEHVAGLLLELLAEL